MAAKIEGARMSRYRLNPGNVHNPLHKGNNRNTPCLCGSGKKSKKCCGIPYFIKEDDLKIIKSLKEDEAKDINRLAAEGFNEKQVREILAEGK